MKKYYSLVQEDKKAEIMIYGDITSWEYYESDVSSYTLSKQLQELDVEEIHVYINSYGGEVSEGLAIYNALVRHKAKVITYCEGFACSAASVVFMAGDERVMEPASLLMIHNAWTYAQGDSDKLKKQAEDLEKITASSVIAYMKYVNIEEETLKEMMSNETWILPEEAVNMEFATRIMEVSSAYQPSQSVKENLMKTICERKMPYNEYVSEKIAEAVAKKILESLEGKNKGEGQQQEKKLNNFLKNLK